MEIGIIDYELSNLGGISSAVKKLGFKPRLIKKPDEIESVEKLILPGVGSFKIAVSNLKRLNLFDKIKFEVQVKKKPLLGICLGMQLLAKIGFEGGESHGLNLIPGKVELMSFAKKKKLTLPHVGWNKIEFAINCSLFDGISNKEFFYFIHSFMFIPDNQNHVIGTTTYGEKFASVLKKDNIYGIQPHPEKSQLYGLKLLQNFLEKNVS